MTSKRNCVILNEVEDPVSVEDAVYSRLDSVSGLTA